MTQIPKWLIARDSRKISILDPWDVLILPLSRVDTRKNFICGITYLIKCVLLSKRYSPN